MTVSTTAVPVARQEKIGLVVIGVIGVLIVGSAAFVQHQSGPARAVAAQKLAVELTAESKVFCTKHGVQANTQAHADCVSDLQAIRDNQTERVNESQLGIL